MADRTMTIHQRGPNILLRLLYFVFIGLWLSGIWTAVAWFLCVIIIGLPLGLWMLNRVPQISTLQPSSRELTITTDGRIYQTHSEQIPFLIRALYFLLIGWWFSGIWLGLAWLFCSSIIGLPIGFWMYNRVPTIITLART